MRQELVDLSDEVWRRLRARFDGLTDDEYLWEPAAGCWTIRPDPTGRWRVDSAQPQPEPAPFTTIAWRLWHLTDMYGEERAPQWLDVEPQGAPVGVDDPDGEPSATAAGALALLDRAHDRWDAHLALVSEDALTEPVGAVGGHYADRTRAAYVLHMLDEFVHHGAEVSLLRDLWRWQHPLDADAVTARAMRGDAGLLDEIEHLDATVARGLVGVAAEYARWDLVLGLVQAGVAVPTEGRSPLHLAAGAGLLDVVQVLVDHGADPETRDPQFEARPQEWAQFLGHDHVAEWLETHGRG